MYGSLTSKLSTRAFSRQNNGYIFFMYIILYVCVCMYTIQNIYTNMANQRISSPGTRLSVRTSAKRGALIIAGLVKSNKKDVRTRSSETLAPSRCENCVHARARGTQSAICGLSIISGNQLGRRSRLTSCVYSVFPKSSLPYRNDLQGKGHSKTREFSTRILLVQRMNSISFLF